MKKQLKYLKLWQQKRNELPINDDMQQGWNDMSELLNQHLPQNNIVASPRSGAINYKIIGAIIITVAAIIIYLLLHRSAGSRLKTGSSTEIIPKSAVSVALNSRGANQNNHDRASAPNSAGYAASKHNLKDSINANGDLLTPSVTSAEDKKYAAAHQRGILHDFNSTTNNPNGNKLTAADNRMSSLNNSTTVMGLNKKVKSSPLVKNHKRIVFGVIKGATQVSAQRADRYQGQRRPGRDFSGGRSEGRSGSRVVSVGDQGRRWPGANTTDKKGDEIAIDPNKTKIDFLPDSGKHDTLLVDNRQASFSASVQLLQARQGFYADSIPFANLTASKIGIFHRNIVQWPSNATQSGAKKGRAAKAKNDATSKFEWGLLAGVNTAGSFTSKSANHNFYGSSIVDAYFGLFSTIPLNQRLALNPQINLLNPQTLSGSYTHANQSKIDSGQTLTISDSRKIYSLNIPVYLVYRLNNHFSIKAGPVLSMPLMETIVSSTFDPGKNHKDSAYYVQVAKLVKANAYQRGFDCGLSGGISLQFQRISFDATYLKSLQGIKVSSTLGSYQSKAGLLQFTLGFKLNGLLPNGIHIFSAKKTKKPVDGG